MVNSSLVRGKTEVCPFGRVATDVKFLNTFGGQWRSLSTLGPSPRGTPVPRGLSREALQHPRLSVNFFVSPQLVSYGTPFRRGRSREVPHNPRRPVNFFVSPWSPDDKEVKLRNSFVALGDHVVSSGHL